MRFKAQISVSLKDKTWQEAIDLEGKFIDAMRALVRHTKSNPRIYFHAKTFKFDVSTPTASRRETRSLSERTTYIMTPRIDDYEVLMDFLSSLKIWYKEHDANLFGRRIAMVVSTREMGDLHYDGEKFIPSRTMMRSKKFTPKVARAIDAFNQDIDNQ